MMNSVRTDILRQVRERDVRMVRFLYCDTSSIIRGKATHVRGLEDRLHSGIGLTVAMQAMCMLDQLANIDGLGAVGEIRLVPDPRTFVVLPYLPRVASMCVDMMTLDNEPWAFCPRSFLKRMIARLEGQGMRIRASFEGEYSLLAADGDMLRPIDSSLCFSTVGMDTSAAVINATIDALEAQGLQVEQYYAELAHGQQELSIRHAEGLDAADNQITYRETVRGVAQQHGLVASFAPKPLVDQAGNGCHLHFSLVGRDGRTSLFYDRGAPYNLSTTARQFTAGVLEHLPALVALTCSSVNSYRRLQPQAWSSAYTCWGPDNREAAIRVASPFAGDEAGTINAELKACDHTSNPYIALGALIAAGLDGIARKLDLPDPVLADPSLLSEADRTARGVKRLPGSLTEALDELAADAVLCGALGPELVSAIQGVKRLEARLFAEQDVDFELNRHNTRF
ncbi:MAG: glnA [Chloroflexi bacterium]|nr:glnA [Chloroflexota bacterium]